MQALSGSPQQIQQLQEAVQQLQKMLHDNGFVPLADAAATLNVPLATLASAIRRHKLPAVAVAPRRWYVPLALVRERYAAAAEPTANDDQAREMLAKLESQGALSSIAPKNQRTSFQAVNLPASSAKSYAEMLIEARR